MAGTSLKSNFKKNGKIGIFISKIIIIKAKAEKIETIESFLNFKFNSPLAN